MNGSTQNDFKMAYFAPRFLKYGNLTDMTNANSMKGTKDGGPSSSKTG